jgi:hypothetical protein
MSKKTPKGPGGRPTKFKKHMLEKAKELAAKGKTNREIAEIFEITEQTFYDWLRNNYEFSYALKEGKQEADQMVEAALFKRAIGYTLPDKQLPPDTTACIFWLKNRKPNEWSEKGDFDGDIEIKLAYNLEKEPRKELSDGRKPTED